MGATFPLASFSAAMLRLLWGGFRRRSGTEAGGIQETQVFVVLVVEEAPLVRFQRFLVLLSLQLGREDLKVAGHCHHSYGHLGSNY